MTEIQKLRESLKHSVMTDVQQEKLIRYFKPVYYVVYEETPPGELFSKTYRIGYYDKDNNRKQALEAFERFGGKRVIEKSILTGKEKIISGV